MTITSVCILLLGISMILTGISIGNLHRRVEVVEKATSNCPKCVVGDDAEVIFPRHKDKEDGEEVNFNEV